eukprot:scaffold13293_cov120-Cylindrotheca_fusiformis.AAC.3
MRCVIVARHVIASVLLGYLFVVLPLASSTNASAGDYEAPLSTLREVPTTTPLDDDIANEENNNNKNTNNTATLPITTELEDGDVGFTKQMMEAFFDEVVPDLMNSSHIAGVSLSVVHTGSNSNYAPNEEEWNLSKGYGTGNNETNEPVNPETTLFRPGSISKLFLWTAIMQQVEQGNLDLHEDICIYFKKNCGGIPTLQESNNPRQYDPITLAHLMTHTPGLEDYMFNLFVKDPSKLMSLEQIVSHRTVKRTLAPGKEIAYSNFGSMLAGRILEVVTGLTFEDYVEEFIFSPLGMKTSTFRQPLPDHLASTMSNGFVVDATTDKMEAKHFELIQGAPAGGLSSSATDMGKFMKAHLSIDDGGLLLKPETKQEMHSLLFRPDKRQNMGFAHGFMDLTTNGLRVIGHGGDTMFFHSLLFLIPEHRLGVYFSINTGKEGMPDFVTLKLFERFMDNFFPAATGLELGQNVCTLEESSNGEQEGGGASSYGNNPAINYSGTFRANRRSESDMTKVNSLFMTFHVTPKRNETGRLLVSSFVMPKEEEYIEIEPHVFQKVDGQDKLLFLLDDDTQQVTGLFASSLPVMTFVKCAWWETKAFNIPVVLFGQICLMAGFFVWPFDPVRRFVASKIFKSQTRYGGSTKLEGQLAQRLATAVVLAYCCFYAAFIYIVTGMDLIFGGSLPMWPFYIPWVAFVLSLPLPLLALQAWQERYWGTAFRVFYTLFAISVQGFFWFLWQWGFVVRSFV